MRGSTFLLRPSDRRENIPFCFSLLSLSDFFFLYLLLDSPIFFYVGFSPFLPYPTHSSLCLLFISFPFHFLFSLIFSSLSFPSFSLFFYSFGLHQPNGSKSGKLPHYFLLCHLSFSHFSYFFFISLFFLM